MQYTQSNLTYVIKLDRGEEVLSMLTKFCLEKNIDSAHFTMIGACYDVHLAYYHLEKKEYAITKFSDSYEVASLIGNVATHSENGELLIHMHGVFSDPTMKTIAGHLNHAIVSAAAEIFLTIVDVKLVKTPDPVTGLNLLDLNS